MANQITEPGGTGPKYYKSACWPCCILGLICIVVCVWIIRINSPYSHPSIVSQAILSPTASLYTLSHKHLYSVHQPVHLVIHTGNSPASSTVSISQSGIPLHLPTHTHTAASIAPFTPPVATSKSNAGSYALPSTATSIPILTPTSTPIASLSTLLRRSISLPLSSSGPSPTETPLPTLDIEATPIQGKATLETAFSKSIALQLPEPGTPVSGH